MRSASLLILGTSLCVGCMQVTSYDPTSTLDEQQLAAMLGSGSYRGSGFQRVSSAPFASGIDGSLVTFYVSDAAAAAYAAVSPESDSAGAAFPIGGIVVREVEGAGGSASGVTVMVKRDSGYFPAVGDFFFGVTDTAGTPQTAGGVIEWGQVQACTTCHETRAAAGYLFGVSAAHRLAATM